MNDYQALQDAVEIVVSARIKCATTSVNPVWDKLRRIGKYLEEQRDAVFQAAFGE